MPMLVEVLFLLAVVLLVATLTVHIWSSRATTLPTTPSLGTTGAPTGTLSGTTESPFRGPLQSIRGVAALRARLNIWTGISCGVKLVVDTLTATIRTRIGSCGAGCNPSTHRPIALAKQTVTEFKSPRTRTMQGPNPTHRTTGDSFESLKPFCSRRSNMGSGWKASPTAA